MKYKIFQLLFLDALAFLGFTVREFFNIKEGMAVILIQYSELLMILGNDQEDLFYCHNLCSCLFLRATGAVRFILFYV